MLGPDRYAKAGHMLGGRGNVTRSGLAWLEHVKSVRNVLLMCVCHEPGVCHRHQDICAPHFPDALHIYEEEVVTARELARAIRLNDDYACEDLGDALMSRSNSSPD